MALTAAQQLAQLDEQLDELLAAREVEARRLYELTGCLYVTSPELRRLRDRIDVVLRRRRRLLVEVDQ